MTTISTPASPMPPLPWWRVGTAWFGVSALAAVMVGSVLLLATAMRHGDSVVEEAVTAPRVVPNEPHSPAQQARNHAATPR